jgi:hypothetical protein
MRILKTTIELFFEFSWYSWAFRERERERDGKGVLVYVASLSKTRHGCHYQLSTTKVPTRVYNMSHFTKFFTRIVWLMRFAF